MRSKSNYEARPLAEDLGEVSLQLAPGRDRYIVRIEGQEYSGGTYDGESIDWFPLKHGEARGVSGDLKAFLQGFAADDGEPGFSTEVGYGAATYYSEDRALAMGSTVAPHLGEDEKVAVLELFEQYARGRFPEAVKLYAMQRRTDEEPVLRRLGYHLLRENRRTNSGGRIRMPMRTWVK